MDLPSIIIIVVFSILMLIFFVIFGIYSRLSFKRERVLEKFKAVDQFLDDRRSLMSRIVAFLEAPSYHEDTLSERMENLNIEIGKEVNVNNLVSYVKKSGKMLHKFLSLTEVYPGLAENCNFEVISNEVNNNDTKIMYAIDIYNEEVLNYNSFKSKKYISTISNLFRFKDFDVYKK